MYNSIVINYLYTLDKNKFSCSDIYIYIYTYIYKEGYEITLFNEKIN